MKNAIINYFDFTKEFFKNFNDMKVLGTPFQSSRYLVDAVSNEVKGNKVVELGAGNGPITKGILAYHPKMQFPELQLTAFEINPKLLKNLAKTKDSRLTIVSESAENFLKYVPEPDCIVSGLPLTSMPRNIVDKVLTSSKKGLYIQYKYWPEKTLLKDYFNNIKSKVVWRNFPPALVYVCKNL